MSKKKVTGVIVDDKIVVDDLDFASEFKAKGYGEIKEKALWLSFYEAAYLSGKDKVSVELKGKALTQAKLLEQGSKVEDRFGLKYAAYQDLRERGYVVRTGLKYGVDFRVYPRQKTIDEAHTKWIIHVIAENEKFDVFHVSRAVRLSHSVKTSLLLAIVDAETDVTYYKMNWIRP